MFWKIVLEAVVERDVRTGQLRRSAFGTDSPDFPAQQWQEVVAEVGAAIPGQRVDLRNGRLQAVQVSSSVAVLGPATLAQGMECD